jgi:hypothetical protein
MDLRGTVDAPVRNLHFEGITFTGTTWRKPSGSGVLNLQAGMFNLPRTRRNEQFAGRPPAAVQASFCEGLTFTHCEFFHTGSTALDLHRGITGSGIHHCHFHDLGGGGISVGVFPSPTSKSTSPVTRPIRAKSPPASPSPTLPSGAWGWIIPTRAELPQASCAGWSSSTTSSRTCPTAPSASAGDEPANPAHWPTTTSAATASAAP